MTVHSTSQDPPARDERSLPGQVERPDQDKERSQEAAKMMELLIRQSNCDTPLSISSKAAQAVIRQF